MRKLILTMIILATVLSSCKEGSGFLGADKKAKEKITQLEKENELLKEELEKIEEKHTHAVTEIRSDYEKKLAAAQQKIETGVIKEYEDYYVILGSFKTPYFAEKYAEKVRELGYEGKIITGPNNFSLVTYGTYKTLKDCMDPVQEARKNISFEAWIFFTN